MKLNAWRVTGSVLAAAVLASCGGGGSDQFAGIDRLGVSSGSVSGFGSIFVNGVEYETDGADFEIDDAMGSEADLDVGDVVTVEWSSEDGVTFAADRVTYDDTLEGPIASIDLTAGSLVVLGQTVRVDGATSFDDAIIPGSLEGLAVGEFIEVSGFIDGDGNIRASRIERVMAGEDELEVRGLVAGVDTLTETFVISGLTVDYSAVVNPPVLENGDFVEVKGESLGANGELLATELELEDQELPGAGTGDEVEVEGFITRFVSATNFDVAGVRVNADSAEYEGGTENDLAINVKVEVEGRLNASGVLVADEIEFRHDDGDAGDGGGDIEIAATVDSDPTGGALVVLGITVEVDALTRLEDKSEAEIRDFGLDDVSAGDVVKIRGLPQDGGTVLATRLEREDSVDEVTLRGPVDSVGGTSVVILGVTVDTDAQTEYRDTDDSPITAAAFFAAVTAGSEVKTSGTETGTSSMLAAELELED